MDDVVLVEVDVRGEVHAEARLVIGGLVVGRADRLEADLAQDA